MMNSVIPATMQGIQLDEANGPLTLRQVPVPRPRAGQVLVRMAAAPINPLDIGRLAGGSYAGETTYPFIPGVEGSGTVVAAGAGFLPGLLHDLERARLLVRRNHINPGVIKRTISCVKRKRFEHIQLEQPSCLFRDAVGPN